MEIAESLGELTQAVKDQNRIHSLVLATHTDNWEYDMLCMILMESMKLPMLNIKAKVDFPTQIGDNLYRFVIVFLNGIETMDMELLNSLWTYLKRFARSKFLLIAKWGESSDYIRTILEFCVKNKVLHVNVIKESFVKFHEIFVPQIFPTFDMKTMKIGNVSGFEFYPERVKNMHGYNINVGIVNGSDRAYITKTLENQVHLSGYLGTFLEEFARKHNATLQQPTISNGVPFFYRSDMLKSLLENNTFDMLAELSVDMQQTKFEVSAMYDILDWCLMVPMEQPLAPYKLLIITFDNKILVIMLCLGFLFSILLALTAPPLKKLPLRD
ncbi:uncharacterized protein LOC133333972, partial [Musca vetustissima]|uniref:uncharacterized protein LOC133333972 n=1 Tax=Musca vetustissima TaxID=27455 RepID=UPI002AB75FAA